MVETFSEDTKNVLTELFRERDDGDGCIRSECLEECMQCVGFCPTQEDIKFLVKHFDQNGDGKMQIEELLANCHVLHLHSIHREELMDSFQKIDQNKDGYIRLPELLKVLIHDDFMPVDEARKLLSHLCKTYDRDGDGKFNYAEFVEIFLGDAFQKQVVQRTESS